MNKHDTENKLRARLLNAQEFARQGALYAPAGFKVASVKELMKVCNGCGAAGAKFDFVPDRIYGTYVGYACFIHDWMYDCGRSIEYKDEADRVFLNNMLRIIDREKKWYKPKGLMRCRAKTYYYFVKNYGGPAFWCGKN